LLGGSGTPTVTGSTIAMTGASKTIDGGGKFLNNLTISNDTTLQNTDLTATGTLQIDAAKTYTINTSRFMWVRSAGTLTLNGILAGAGTLGYQPSTTFPTSGTINSRLLMDATLNNQTLSARTYGGEVELYNNSASAIRTITLGTAGSQTLTFSSNFLVDAAN